MKLNPNKTQKGFSVMELVVSIGIFVFITGILLANFPSFSSNISLENLVYEIALSIRESQVYGLSVKAFEGQFTYGYGIHFDNSDQQSFTLFADINDNQKFDSAIACGLSGSECVEKYNFQTNDRIEYLCWGLRSALPGDTESIADIINDPSKAAVVNSQCNIHSNLDIIFKRPNPEANIIGYGLIADQTYADTEIVAKSPKGLLKTVIVWSTGQISVE